MQNIIAALMLAVGLVVSAWVYAGADRYEYKIIPDGGARLLFDRKTGMVFLADNQQWMPRISFHGKEAK